MLETDRQSDKRWEAVASRAPSADGTFYYAVRTTGVYCRPSCASRLPRRENVSFHASCAAAEAAGFRACKGCRPTERTPVEAQLAAVSKACAILAERETAPPLAELAAAVGVSPFHFHRLFKQVIGATPREYARARRVARFGQALDRGERVSEAAYASGFGSRSRAYEDALSGMGMTPGARRRAGKGEVIRFATAKTALGWVLVAATEKGICAAELGDPREATASSPAIAGGSSGNASCWRGRARRRAPLRGARGPRDDGPGRVTRRARLRDPARARRRLGLRRAGRALGRGRGVPQAGRDAE